METSSAVQVQGTNDEATISKRSAIRKGYYRDPYLRHFVRKPSNRCALINRGYYLRVTVIRRLIARYLSLGPSFYSAAAEVDGSTSESSSSSSPSSSQAPSSSSHAQLGSSPRRPAHSLSHLTSSSWSPSAHKCTARQIVSLGAGFDTSPFLCFDAVTDALPECALCGARLRYVEMDFPGVAGRKAACIGATQELAGAFVWARQDQEGAGGVYFSGAGWRRSGREVVGAEYHLLGLDLTDLRAVSECVARCGVASAAPVLFLAECVLNYIDPDRVGALIAWATASFPDVAFIRFVLKTRHTHSLVVPWCACLPYPVTGAFTC